MKTRELSRLYAWLADVEDGVIVLTPESESAADIYAGNVAYVGSDGSRAVVFNDCNDWDYLDSITFADGSHFDFDDLPAYNPSIEVAMSRYGFPSP